LVGAQEEVTFLRLICCALLLTHASKAQVKVSIDDSIPIEFRALFQAVASDVYSVVLEIFHGRPPLDLPIIIFHSDPWPVTSLNDWLKPTEIRIGTTVTQGYIEQFAFQFAHEMGHVMLDPRRNSGFGDAVCTALSLEVLGRLSVKWRTAPPLASLLGFDLLRYRRLIEEEMMPEFPPDIRAAVLGGNWQAVTAYLRKHRQEIEPSDARYRTTQRLAVLAMLSKTVAWADLRGIAACTEPSPEKQPMFSTLPISPACLRKVRDIDCTMGADCGP
jgi:hypothetical protein